MEENKVVISAEEFARLVAAETKLQIVKKMVEYDNYLPTATLKILLDIEGGEKNG